MPPGMRPWNIAGETLPVVRNPKTRPLPYCLVKRVHALRDFFVAIERYSFTRGYKS